MVERTTALEREHQRAETLLRISTELVTSLDLDQVLTRALQLVNEAIGADQAAIVLLDPETQLLVYRASLEKDAPLARGGRSLPFRAGEGLAGWVIQQRQSVILPDLANDPRWVHLYPQEPMRYHSALAVPLMVGADALGALLLMSQDPSVFNPDQLRLASAAANQVAAAINNAELYRLIRDQAERLGGLVRSQQVESRKSRAMLEAIADGVMVTDDENRIVLFNDAAERLLGLRREQVDGRAAGEFIGLFGKAGRAWQEKLRRWQSAPAEITGGEYLAERITLDSGKVLSVHLAPVSSREEFIGTVAVFRDITQDVEVDRLKSEFVATVSHELRTPMTAIKGYTEILMMGATGPLNDAQRQFLNIVKDNSDRLGLLVNDLLDISRIESGQTRLNLDVVDIHKLLEEIAAGLRERCRSGGKSLEIAVDAEPDLPLDPGRSGRGWRNSWEPRGERLPVHSRRRKDYAAGADACRRGADRCVRHGHRHSPGRTGAGIRAVLPRRESAGDGHRPAPGWACRSPRDLWKCTGDRSMWKARECPEREAPSMSFFRGTRYNPDKDGTHGQDTDRRRRTGYSRPDYFHPHLRQTRSHCGGQRRRGAGKRASRTTGSHPARRPHAPHDGL